MEESKTTLHITLDMVISGTLLVLCAGAIFLAQQLWAVFSSQEAANNKLKDYMNYAAYDGTEISGQDVLNLLISLEETDPNKFVIVNTRPKNYYAADGTLTHVNSKWVYYIPSAANTPCKMHNNSAHNEASELEWVTRMGIGSSIQLDASTKATLSTRFGISESTLNNQLKLSTIIGNSRYKIEFQNPPPAYPAGGWQESVHERIVRLFTDPVNYGGYKDVPAAAAWTPGYSKFLSLLVYDSDSSADPIGYIFIQED